MFKINLVENAGTAFVQAKEALNRILAGEADYQNYRMYVLNLHSALELFFKKKLYDHSDFMIFSFTEYNKMMDKYEKAYRAEKSIWEYVEDVKANLPHTVTFIDAIKRLAYLYHEKEFSIDYIGKLIKLNDIRNNITHFSLDLEDDEFVLLNELFLQCADYYMMYVEWEMNFEIEETFIKKKNLTIKEAIVADEYNRMLLKILDSDMPITDDCIEYSFLASGLIADGKFEERDKEKIVKRLEIFDNAGFYQYQSASGEHWDVGWYVLTSECIELIKKFDERDL